MMTLDPEYDNITRIMNLIMSPIFQLFWLIMADHGNDTCWNSIYFSSVALRCFSSWSVCVRRNAQMYWFVGLDVGCQCTNFH